MPRSVSGAASGLLLGLLILLPCQARQPLYVHETEFLRAVYYSTEHEYLVPHLVRCFENSLAFHRELFDYTPSEEIVLLLHDFGDYGHGGTSTVPWNYITIGIEPFDYVYETMPANERMNWLMHHELVHVVATDKGAGSDDFWRKVFTGKVTPVPEQPLSMLYSYMTSPRWYAPRWYHEGIAVFLETWMAGGMGRVLGGYDEMVFRTMVLEDDYFYQVVGLESEGTAIDFQVGQNSYLYGTRFVVYLALTHGPEKVVEWFNRGEGSKRYFSKQFRQVYGTALDEEWNRWIAWEHEWQARNLERVRAFPVTPDEPVVERALGSVSRAYHDPEGGRLFVAVNYPGRNAHIVSLDLEMGAMRKITEITGPALYYVTSLAYDPAAGKLFFTTDNGNGWRDLYEVEIETGRRRRLLEDFRGGDLVIHPVDRSLWAVQHHNGYSSILTIPQPYSGWHVLHRFPYGTDLFNLDISPDGSTLVAGLIGIDGRQRLVTMDTEALLLGDGSHEVLHDFQTTGPANFVFSPDGRYLYGSSYYTGVSNVFRYDRETGAMEAMSNAETGYFRPLPISDETLLAFRYTGEGFLPVTFPQRVLEDVNAIDYLGQQIVETHPEVREWNAGSPADIDLEEVTTYRGEYRAARRIRLASVYPVVEGYKDDVVLGARLNFADQIGLHGLDLTASVTVSGENPSDERFHLNMNYRRWPWRITAAQNGTDFYDLFGPTKTSRKGTAAGVTYENYLINKRPKVMRYALNLSAYRGLERLPLYQNVETEFDQFQTFTGQIRYADMRGSIGGVDREKGVGWDFGLLSHRAEGEFFTRLWTDLDYGLRLPLDHSSVWLRGSLGHSFGPEESTFSNFYFGGFGNNYVDHLPVQRYRAPYTFPGVDLNAIEANSYGRLMLEWTLPPLRFRRVGAPGFYLNWMQAALFATGLVSDPDRGSRRQEYTNAGIQLNLKLVIFSNLPSTLSFGYARALEGVGGRSSDELMLSLNILH